jgi:hypothetical protein
MAAESDIAVARWRLRLTRRTYVLGGRTLWLLLTFSALLPAAAVAQPRSDLEEEESEKKEWVELEVKPPPYPKRENLIPFEVSAASSNRFYIDPESISVGSDGVVRYTLVIRGPTGAENISYEGIRCETREQKYYAFGRRDGSWSSARSGAWRRIEYKEINRQHGVLYLDFFCPDKKRPVGPPAVIIRHLKYGAPPRSGSITSKRFAVASESGDRRRRRSEQDQVVPVDQFGLVDVAEFGFNLA